jgi:hypothetical protein
MDLENELFPEDDVNDKKQEVDEMFQLGLNEDKLLCLEECQS